MGMPEVFELTTASARRQASTRSSSACLASIRSTMASTTQSHSPTAGRSVSNPPSRMRARTSFVKNGSGLRAAACSSPRAAVSASRSSSSTGQPALATWAAIWAPMVPAPSTATERIVCITASFHRRGRRRSRPRGSGAGAGGARRTGPAAILPGTAVKRRTDPAFRGAHGRDHGRGRRTDEAPAGWRHSTTDGRGERHRGVRLLDAQPPRESHSRPAALGNTGLAADHYGNWLSTACACAPSGESGANSTARANWALAPSMSP